MKVIFIMYAFPNLDEGYNMYTTLVEEFICKGHEVTVVAPCNKPTRLSQEKGIEILRVCSIQSRNVSKLKKGLSTILLPYQFLNAIKKYYPIRTYDLIISATPPITFASVIEKIKQKYQSKFYLILRDIFPQNAVDLGYISPTGFTYHYFRKIEKKYYNLADYIGCMSEGNIDYITRHNPDIVKKDLHILRNFQKENKNEFVDLVDLRRRYNLLKEDFIVVFGGNLGKPQQLENVLELAKRTLEYTDVKFFLVGEGNEMEKLEKTIKKLNLTNIILQSSVSKSKYQDLLRICDVGLISLHKDFTIPNIPSKILDYMNIGVPILASLDKSTDFNEILEESQSGLWSFSGDHNGFKSNLDVLYKNKVLRKEMGRNGNEYFKQYLLPECAYKTIIERL